MICTAVISPKEASIIAVAVLDDMVRDLVQASCPEKARAFLDWIADEATPLLEQKVLQSFQSPHFANSLRLGDPRIALSRWVLHWVSPWIAEHFSHLAAHLPEFVRSRLSSKAMVAQRPQLPAFARKLLSSPGNSQAGALAGAIGAA